MRVFRLCNQDEIDSIFKNRSFEAVGHECKSDPKINTHDYLPNKKYMHFFEKASSLPYLTLGKGKSICVYDIPDDVLNGSEGIGFYFDYIDFIKLHKLNEYAICTEKMQFQYLTKVYLIEQDIDIDIDFNDYPTTVIASESVPSNYDYSWIESQIKQIIAGNNAARLLEERKKYVEKVISDRVSCTYDYPLLKSRLEQILRGDDIATSLEGNIEDVEKLIPEIKYMKTCEHKHPEHHLDVWQHTLEVIRNLNTHDLELNMAALLHDIGKPFSYQDGEVRHFHGHPEVSYDMTKKILVRLGYDEDFIKRVSYLVRKHDTLIDVNGLDNNSEMIKKLLRLQYADARAHHPDKVEKRIKILNGIKAQLDEYYRDR